MEINNVVKQVLNLLLTEQKQARKILLLTQAKKKNVNNKEHQTFINTNDMFEVQISNLENKLNRLAQRGYECLHDEVLQNILLDMNNIREQEKKLSNNEWYESMIGTDKNDN